MLGFSTHRLTTSEKWVTAGLLTVVCLLLVTSIINGGLNEEGTNILYYLIVGVSLTLLFPKLLHDLNINLGNIYVTALWLVIVLTFYFISAEIVFLIPLIMFIYFHLMRAIHFWTTGRTPAYNAHRWTLNSLDKHANRKVTKNDLNFMMLYMSLPLITCLIFAWLESFNSLN